MKKVLLISLLVMSCLVSGNWVEQLRRGNYSLVKIGKYAYTTKTIRRGGDSERELEWRECIDRMRPHIEQNQALFDMVTKHFFPEEENTIGYSYKFSSIDEARNKLILRYFGPIPFPKILAGYECQLVVDLESCLPEKIYLSPIPLER